MHQSGLAGIIDVPAIPSRAAVQTAPVAATQLAVDSDAVLAMATAAA